MGLAGGQVAEHPLMVLTPLDRLEATGPLGGTSR
jgi:hypothetical protein